MRSPCAGPRAPRAGRLFQEDLLEQPFWMLVACSLVNLTTWEQARPAFAWLRRNYEDAHELACAFEEDLHAPLQPLGLWRRRAKSLILMANAWIESPPRCYDDVMALPGCGKYAADSWAMFVEGRDDVQPKDGKLLWYLQQLKEQTDGKCRARGGRPEGAPQQDGA